jgi:hypothetical protein
LFLAGGRRVTFLFVPAINLQRVCRWGWRRPWLCSGGYGSDVLPHVGCRRGWVLSHLVQLSVMAGTMSRSCSWKLHRSAVGGRECGSCGGGGSLLVAWLKRLSELDGHGWLCGERRHPLVCLGAVKPFVYVGGTRVPWRRLAARSLRPPPPDADGVVALGGLGCALPLGYVDGCCGVVSLHVACRPHPRCRWCRGVVWSWPRTSVRPRRWHGAPVWTRLFGTDDYVGSALCSDMCLPPSCHAPLAWDLMGLPPLGGSSR